MSRDKLSKHDWLEAGRDALAAHGIASVKADVLAKTLGVSRGSFYWHFPDVAGFHRALLAAWEKQATADVIASVERGGGDAVVKLHRLARTVFAADGALERQVRAWAAQQKVAARVQDRVDRTRIAFVRQLLRAAGHDARSADVRARFLYLTLVGLFSTGRRYALDESDVTNMIELLIAAP